MAKKKGTRKKTPSKKKASTKKKPAKAEPVRTLPPPPSPTVTPNWKLHHGHDAPQFGCHECAQLNRGMWVCVCLCPNEKIAGSCIYCGEEKSATGKRCTCECSRKSHKDMSGACDKCVCKKFQPASRLGGAR